MKTFKLFALIILVFIFSSLNTFGQKKVVHPIKPKDFDGLGLTNDFKVLAEGFNSKVDSPFIFVARDTNTYATLQNLVEGLPDASTIDFQTNAVVAGFAGTRSTGGWTVEIRKAVKNVLVDIKGPRKGDMVTQMITTPFKVSLVPVEANKALPLDASATFTNKMQSFVVKRGDFEFTGGFAGRKKQFKADGTIKLLTFGEYISGWFDLKGKGAEQKRRLFELTSGSSKSGNIEFARLDAGSFVDPPRPPFAVKGTLNGKILLLNFEPLPTNVADGYEGKGNLEAVMMK